MKKILFVSIICVILISGCIDGHKEKTIKELELGNHYTKIYEGTREFTSSEGFVRSKFELIEKRHSKYIVEYNFTYNELERIPTDSSIIVRPKNIFVYYNENGEKIGGEDDSYKSDYEKPVKLFNYPLAVGDEWFVEIKDMQEIKGTNNSFETLTNYHFKVESVEDIEIMGRKYRAIKVIAKRDLEIDDVWGLGKSLNLTKNIKTTSNTIQTYWITSELGIVKKVEKEIGYINSRKTREITVSYVLIEFENE